MKKRTLTLLGVSLLVVAVAIPVYARAHWWGGGHMMGGWGMMGYGPYSGWGPGTAAPEQVQKLQELERKYYTETAELRTKLWEKSAELETLLAQTNPDPEKVKAIQKEIDDLRSKLSEKDLEYRLEARKVTPYPGFAGGYGFHMGGYGPGTTCWY